MPLLLSVLQNANTPEYRKLRVKAMECAGLIGEFSNKFAENNVEKGLSAIAVGRDTFRPDSRQFIELLMGIQSKLLLLTLLGSALNQDCFR